MYLKKILFLLNWPYSYHFQLPDLTSWTTRMPDFTENDLIPLITFTRFETFFHVLNFQKKSNTRLKNEWWTDKLWENHIISYSKMLHLALAENEQKIKKK